MIISGGILGCFIPEDVVIHGLHGQPTPEEILKMIKRALKEALSLEDTVSVSLSSTEYTEIVFSKCSALVQKIMSDIKSGIKAFKLKYGLVESWLIFLDSMAEQYTFTAIFNSNFMSDKRLLEDRIRQLVAIAFPEEFQTDYVLSLQTESHEKIFRTWDSLIKFMVEQESRLEFLFSVCCGTHHETFLIEM